MSTPLIAQIVAAAGLLVATTASAQLAPLVFHPFAATTTGEAFALNTVDNRS